MTLTNDVAELSGVVRLTSADVTLGMDGRDCSFKTELMGEICSKSLVRVIGKVLLIKLS